MPGKEPRVRLDTGTALIAEKLAIRDGITISEAVKRLVFKYGQQELKGN